MSNEFIVSTNRYVDTDNPPTPQLADMPEARIARVLGAALERGFFTAKELARQAGVARREADTVLEAYSHAFERLFVPHYLFKGEWFFGLRIKPEARTFVSGRVRQLIPKQLVWVRPAISADQHQESPESISSAEEGLRTLTSLCSLDRLEKEETSRLWASILTDLEIAKHEIADLAPLNRRADRGTIDRIMRILNSMVQLDNEHRIVDRIFDGSKTPRRSIDRLKGSIGVFDEFNPKTARIELKPPFARNASEAVAKERHRTQRIVVKRLFDLCIASISIVSFLPLLFIVAIIIKLDSRGPILFRQTRRGLGGRRFYIYKFRTMSVLDDGDVVRQASMLDGRVTRIGRFLRSSNIDELPQLVNVLTGDMSLVGPRPQALAHDTYENIVAEYANRHFVKPGITGLAQVNGHRGEERTREAIERSLEFDRYYVDNWSLWLDVKILLRTIFTSSSYRNSF